MFLDERKAKVLFSESGLAVGQGLTVWPGESVRPGFAPPYVLKSQVLSGGRGKAGGILKVESSEDLAPACQRLFRLPIAGKLPPCLLLEPWVRLEREFYLSFAVSRERESLVFTVRASGGIEVESLAGQGLSQNVCIYGGPYEWQIRDAFFRLNLAREHYEGFRKTVRALFAAVRKNGLLLAEINPLGLTESGEFLAVDAKAELDESVVELRPELESYREPGHYAADELAARQAGFSFVKLEGRVGCLANGAGLAMASLDALNFAGLAAANFLDLGGAADAARIRTALGLLFAEPRLEALFINLYGGILSCAKVANALCEVMCGNPPAKPIVARLSGNGAAEGRDILKLAAISGLHLAQDMGQAIGILGSLCSLSEPTRFELPEPAPAKLEKLSARPGRGRDFPSLLELSPNSRVVVQGLTGKTASFHARLMREYGVNVAAGVTPFKGGMVHEGVPVFDSLSLAHKDGPIDLSLIFVPGAFASEAILEAARAGVPWIVCITEGIPQKDMLGLLPELRRSNSRLIGPNTPGVLLPGLFKAGIMPADPFRPGHIAVFSRSGTLTYEASARLSAAGLGQALAVGVGGDPFIGEGFAELLELVREDARVKSVLLLGEIGGRAEEDAAAYVKQTSYPKPVACFVAGLTAPPGKRMGHAGAILEPGTGYGRKLAALEDAGIKVCRSLDEIPGAMAGLGGF